MINRQILDMVDVGIITLDRDLKITDWNKWIEYRSEKETASIMDKKITDIFENLDKPWFINNCRSSLKFGNYAFFSQKLHKYCIPLKAEGKLRKHFDFMQQNCTLGPLRDEKRKIIGLFLMVTDVTEITHYEIALTKMANEDGLTGVWNRQFFDRRIKEECSRHRRFKRTLTVIIFDIDYFKKVNDTLGHPFGDFVLQELTSIIKNRIRDIDLLARYGGEEFIILLPETELNQGVHLAEVLRELTEKHQFIHEGNNVSITISLGVASTSGSECQLEDLIKRADDALYESKKKGRNRVSSIVSAAK